MNYVFGIRGQAQNHIMVLTAVKSTAKQLRALQKLARKHAEMTDVIICPKVIGRKIRLKMQGNHIINAVALKGRFIAVNIVRVLLVDDLDILIQYGGVQHVVMVKKPDVFACCHFITPVCIS